MTTPTILTTKQVADRLGITVQWVNRLAKAEGIGQVTPPWNYRLFTEHDVAAIVAARRPLGRPPTRRAD